MFYGTDYTKPLLFVADGGYYASPAQSMHLTGDQWGVTRSPWAHRRGRSDLAGLVLGSTAHKVIHLSDRQVLVVR